MKIPFKDIERRVVPRWRSVDDSFALDEGIPPLGLAEVIETQSLEARRAEWKSDPSAAFAGDLISAAITSGERSSVREVAKQVLEGDEEIPELLRQTARSILGERENRLLVAEEDRSTLVAPQTPTGKRGRLIRGARRSLGRHARNPYLWLELARQHTILGNIQKARREIEVARHLAPDDSLILRSIARFHLHDHDVERAAHLLGGARKLKVDPWLLSAEIAVVQAAGRTSRHTKAARALLDQEPPSARTAELSAAVGSLELEAGSDRKARRLFERTLVEPTENSFSQVVWSQYEGGLAAFDLESLPAIEQNYEGPALEAYFSGEWAASLRFAEAWQDQEPFSGRPAALGSFLASLLVPDFSNAEEILRVGLGARPDDPLLLNNLAFVHAERGRLLEADRALDLAERADEDGAMKSTVLATRGLVAFRRNQPEQGRAKYLESIENSKARKDLSTATLAGVMLARELRARGDEGDKELIAAVEESFERLSQRDKHLVDAVSKAVLGQGFNE